MSWNVEPRDICEKYQCPQVQPNSVDIYSGVGVKRRAFLVLNCRVTDNGYEAIRCCLFEHGLFASTCIRGSYKCLVCTTDGLRCLAKAARGKKNKEKYLIHRVNSPIDQYNRSTPLAPKLRRSNGHPTTPSSSSIHQVPSAYHRKGKRGQDIDPTKNLWNNGKPHYLQE